jgi:hypothetical protein
METAAWNPAAELLGWRSRDDLAELFAAHGVDPPLICEGSMARHSGPVLLDTNAILESRFNSSEGWDRCAALRDR